MVFEISRTRSGCYGVWRSLQTFQCRPSEARSRRGDRKVSDRICFFGVKSFASFFCGGARDCVMKAKCQNE